MDRGMVYRRDYYQKNKAKIRAGQKAYYEAHKGEWGAKCQAWREKNPEKVKESRQRWSAKNKERESAIKKAYAESERGQAKKHEYYENRRDHIRQAVVINRALKKERLDAKLKVLPTAMYEGLTVSRDAKMGRYFEALVSVCLRRAGYTIVPMQQDRGVDLWARKDGKMYAISCKNTRVNVGAKEAAYLKYGIDAAAKEGFCKAGTVVPVFASITDLQKRAYQVMEFYFEDYEVWALDWLLAHCKGVAHEDVLEELS